MYPLKVRSQNKMGKTWQTQDTYLKCPVRGGDMKFIVEKYIKKDGRESEHRTTKRLECQKCKKSLQ